MGVGKALSLVALCAILAATFVQARKGFGDGGQEYGYVEVRPGAHMFYWLYYVNGGDNPAGKPLVIWLQGGPGASGAGYGNFHEIGPLDENLNKRDSSWVNYVNLMFIDNPVGVGFSYVENGTALSTNNQQIATDLVALMKGFLTTYTQFQSIPIYIFCESYGGKMTAEFALNLYKESKAGNVPGANLKGVALGDSWISPIDSVMSWGPYLLSTGMVDDQGYNTIMESAQKTKAAVEAGEWEQATTYWGDNENVISSETYNVDFYNILTRIRVSNSAVRRAAPRLGGKSDFFRWLMLENRYGDSDDDKIEALMNTKVREALGVLPTSVVFEDQSNAVFNALAGDFMKPVVNIVEQLLSDTDLEVNVLSGQLDLIVDTPGTLAWAERMKWSGADYWVNSVQAARQPLVVNNVIEGYYKSYGKFCFYWVDRAGHMVPHDNPTAAVEILRRVTGFDQS